MSDAYAVKIRGKLPPHQRDGLTPHAVPLYDSLGNNEILIVARCRVATRTEVDEDDKPNVTELALMHVEMVTLAARQDKARDLLLAEYRMRTGADGLPFDPPEGVDVDTGEIVAGLVDVVADMGGDEPVDEDDLRVTVTAGGKSATTTQSRFAKLAAHKAERPFA